MSKQINLTVRKREDKKRFRTLFLISIGVFGLMLFFSILSFAINFFLTNQVNNLNIEEEGLNVNIKKYSTKKTNLLIVQERLMSIDKILKSRVDPNVKVKSTLALVPSNIEIGSFYTSKNAVRMDLRSSDLYGINQLIDNFSYFKEKDIIKKVDLTSFGFDTEAYNYRLSLSLEF